MCPLIMPKPGPPRWLHACAAGVEGVGHWVVLPHLAKRRVHITGGITTYQVDLAVEVARTHEGSNVSKGAPLVQVSVAMS